MIKKIRAYLIRTRIKSLRKVQSNAVKEGWFETAALTRKLIVEHEAKLAENE